MRNLFNKNKHYAAIRTFKQDNGYGDVILAIRNFMDHFHNNSVDKYCHDMYNTTEFPSDILIRFSWASSPQGFDFWKSAHKKL